MKPLEKLTDVVTVLPRGGYLVDTPAGYIQFGAPPETVKDTMLLPEGVPRIFVLPAELFNWIKGMSIAEMEFPIYYNFFFKKQKTCIICYKEQASRFKKVLQESLFGPKKLDFSEDFEDVGYGEDIKREIDYFRIMDFPDVVRFCNYKDDSYTIKGITIKINNHGNFEVFNGDDLIAMVPGKIEYKAKYQIGERLHEPYLPPLFGITCLGPSSGFDPYENTSGFIIWLNHHGIMIDPPVNSTEWLLDSNVSPKFIDSIILTHCHADHDAGTFQKILEEGKITVYTTKTILMSFLRKYSALTKVSSDYLKSLFNFHPVKVGKPVFIHGGKFEIFYSLHSIPTIGFRIEFQNQSLTYSSDHNNNPDLQDKLLKEGVICQKRFDRLKKFPWDSNVVFHESGVPPLHTSIDYLNTLPEEIQKKTVVYHIPKKDMPEKTNLTLATFGMENTLYFETQSPPFEKTYQILGMLKDLDFSRNMTISKAQEFISIVDHEKFNKGDVIIKKGSPGDKFYIIYSGNVSIQSEDGKYEKIYGSYDYFGEAALIKGEKRSAEVVAQTDVVLYSIDKDRFLNLITGTIYEKTLKHLINIRDNEAWAILSSSRFLKFFTSTQRTWLESMLSPLKAEKPGVLIRQGEKLNKIFIIRKGAVDVIKSRKKITVLKKGDIVGSIQNLHDNLPSDYTFSHKKPLSLYSIDKTLLIEFLDKNPGLIMKIKYDF